jgi:hypothetical protein
LKSIKKSQEASKIIKKCQKELFKCQKSGKQHQKASKTIEKYQKATVVKKHQKVFFKSIKKA